MKRQPTRPILTLVIFFCSAFFATIASSQQVIWVPSYGGGGPSYSTVTIDKPVTIIMKEGPKHVLQKATILGINGSISADMGFSTEESNSFLGFSVCSNSVEKRQTLEDKKLQYYYVFIPVSEMARITIPDRKESSEFKVVTVSLRKEGVPLPTLALDPSLCYFQVIGEEDMGEFGKAKFDQTLTRLDSFKELSLSPLPVTQIATKSKLELIVTEVAGNKHNLSDIRLPNDVFTFWKGEAQLQLDPNKVQTVNVLSPVDKDRDWEGYLCSVTLRSGAKQELVWKEKNGIGGKTAANLYELIPIMAIKTLEFTVWSNKTPSTPASRPATRP